MTTARPAIRLSVADGTTMHAYLPAPPRARPSGDHAPTGVIVAHELFAVNPDIRRVADELAEAGYLTIAPEFYHRDAPPGRWLERDEAGREEGLLRAAPTMRADSAVCMRMAGSTAVASMAAGDLAEAVANSLI